MFVCVRACVCSSNLDGRYFINFGVIRVGSFQLTPRFVTQAVCSFSLTVRKDIKATLNFSIILIVFYFPKTRNVL